MRHVFVMSATGAIGLMAVFVVDLLNLFYISLLHKPTLTAAIGFTGAIAYIQLAICIGLSIGLGAISARFIGAGRQDLARQHASGFLVWIFLITEGIGLLTTFYATPMLHLLGASGETLRQARLYLWTVSPFLSLIAFGMAFSSMLRSVGDARHAMNVTIAGAVITALFDPVLIFGLHLDLWGAAISTVLSRLGVVILGFYVLRPHNLLTFPSLSHIIPAGKEIGPISLPAILTNLATPIGGGYITHMMARFGLEAVAGMATIDRIVPVAFAFIFALTGSVGPIMSQNYGAGQIERVHITLLSSLKMIAASVFLMWALLALFQNQIVILFSAHGKTADIIHLFCSWIVGGYLFLGMLFVANVAFNNLGFPFLSTLFNWGRATLGTIPFVWIGSHYGPEGILFGQITGCIPFGIGSVWIGHRIIGSLKKHPLAISTYSAEIIATTDKAALAELEEETRYSPP